MADNQSPTSTRAADLALDEQEPRNSEQRAGTVAYWCYQCNKEVIAESDVRAGGVDGVPPVMVCPDCRSGFIEMMATAQTVPDVRLAQRRHLRRRERTSDHRNSIQVESSEEVDDPYPLEVLRLLRVLARTTRNSQRSSARSTEDQLTSRSQGSGQEMSESPGPGSVQLSSSFLSVSGSGNGQEEENVGHAALEEELSSRSEAFDSVLVDEETTEAAENVSIFLVDDVSLSQEDEVEEGEESDSEAEARLLGLGDWDSLDEEDDEEWEEVDGDELDVTRMTIEDGDERMREENPAAADVNEWENNFPGDSEEQQSRTEQRPRSRNVYRNLHHRLLEILRNMDGHNFEVRLGTPEIDTYVGNPGDYVDARGFEQLLQQLLENDNSRRGAPPAAKTTLEALPLVTIQQENLDDGSALCAICKDVVALGKAAKQLPCLHLYHDNCIVPWLSSRNSCPVCRYELPTDDPDYEEQKRQNMQQASNHGTSIGAGNNGFRDSQEDRR